MDFLKMMAQAKEMMAKVQEIQASLATMSVSGSAGGGLVTVETDGRGTVRRVSIDPTVVNPADVEMLEDLVTVATQEAQRKARELAEREMRQAAGGLGLGGLPFSLPF